MAVYAILKDNKVINTAEWDEVTPWQLPGIVVKVPPDMAVEAGWTWNGSELIPPVVVPPEEMPIVEEEPVDLG